MIRRGAILIVNAMQRSNTPLHETDLVCTYGLSHHLHRDTTKIRKAGAISIVLDAQRSQREECKKIDYDLIADIYAGVTEKNQVVAGQRGKELEVEVQELWASSPRPSLAYDKSQPRRQHHCSHLETNHARLTTRMAC